MKNLKIKEIASAIGADIVCGMPNDEVTRVSHDSRDAGPGTLFFCLIRETGICRHRCLRIEVRGAAAGRRLRMGILTI